MPKILVIDDEPQIRRALRTSLEAHGYEVATVGTGEEGVVGVAEQAPDLVLLDLGLPDIDGTEVIRRVRAFSDVPVIGVTSLIRHDTSNATFCVASVSSSPSVFVPSGGPSISRRGNASSSKLTKAQPIAVSTRHGRNARSALSSCSGLNMCAP